LVRTGDREDGQAQLREFQSVEAEFLDLEHEDREVDAITRSAIALFHGGDPDGAIDSLQAGIVTYPNAGRLRMNLATIESRLGQTEAAIASYEQMIALGVGPQFLVHRNLAEQYAAIGDDEAAQRHREIYRRTRESELIVYLPE
jgi:tetratricopeptide (TPR) repeat protein